MLVLNQLQASISFSLFPILGRNTFSCIAILEQTISIVHQQEPLNLLNFLLLQTCKIGMPNLQLSSELSYLRTNLQLQLSISAIPIVVQHQKLNLLNSQKKMCALYSTQRQKQIMSLLLQPACSSILEFRGLQTQIGQLQRYEAQEESQ